MSQMSCYIIIISSPGSDLQGAGPDFRFSHKNFSDFSNTFRFSHKNLLISSNFGEIQGFTGEKRVTLKKGFTLRRGTLHFQPCIR